VVLPNGGRMPLTDEEMTALDGLGRRGRGSS
jgi:hypothetical protein